MSDRYKLLKDAPGYPAGTEFVLTNPTAVFAAWQWERGDGKTIDNRGTARDAIIAQILDTFHADTEWFEKLPLPRWRAQPGASYYMVNSAGTVRRCDDEFGKRGKSQNRYDYGNYFRTEEEASAVAKCVRTLLSHIRSGDEDLEAVVESLKYAASVVEEWRARS